MIKLFYTGAGSFNTAQTLASKSLGGFISNTAVPNGFLNSLFTPLSLMDFYKEKKITEYIGLGLYLFFFENEENLSQIKLNFELSYNQENEDRAELFRDLFEYKVAIAPISGDMTNGFYMESITNGAKPLYLERNFEVLNFEQVVSINSVKLNNSGVGIWLSRTFNPISFKERFGLESDYWKDHDKLPILDFLFNIKIDFDREYAYLFDVEDNQLLDVENNQLLSLDTV